MFFLGDDFGGPVEAGADGGVPGDALGVEVAAAEVDNLGSLPVPHDVLQLDIPMDDMVQMQFFQTSADLVDDLSNDLRL